jgi:hypothetical protein
MHSVWALILLALTLFVFSVPLWPAFTALQRKDTRRLEIDSLNDGSASYAAGLDGQPKVVNALVNAGETVNVLSALKAIKVCPGTTFRWLDAPTIEFLDVDGNASNVRTMSVMPIPEIGLREKFKRIEGDWQTQANSEIHGDYLITQDVLLAENTVVHGSIKAYGCVKLSRGALVYGSIFAQKNIELLPESFVAGVISSNQQVYLHGASLVGDINHLVSVNAPYIVAEVGTMVHGSLQASVHGSSKF